MRQIIAVLLTIFLFISCGRKTFPYQIIKKDGKSLVVDILTKKTFYTLNKNTINYPKEVDSMLKNNLTKIALPGDSLVLVKDLNSETIYVLNPAEEKKKENRTKLFLILVAISILSVASIDGLLNSKKVWIWTMISISFLTCLLASIILNNIQSTSFFYLCASLILIFSSLYLAQKKEKDLFRIFLILLILSDLLSVFYFFVPKY